VSPHNKVKSITPPQLAFVFTAVTALLFVSLWLINPTELEANQLELVAVSVKAITYGFIIISMLTVIWVLFTIRSAPSYERYLELYTVIILMAASIATFGLVYRTNGLMLDGLLVYPGFEDAFLLSVSLFTSNGMVGGFSPFEEEKVLVAIQQLVGFIMVPVMIALTLQIVMASPEQSE